IRDDLVTGVQTCALPIFARLAAGSTISHLYQRDLVSLVLTVPAQISEQRAIAAAISDAERELAVIRDRLGKARDVKLGMMQELQIGRASCRGKVWREGNV